MEQISESNDDEIHALRDSVHKINNILATQTGVLHGINKSLTEMTCRLDSHMTSEERTNASIYKRLKSLDDEVKESFKERDNKINTLDKAQVKLVAYMAGVSGTVLIIIETAFKVMS